MTVIERYVCPEHGDVLTSQQPIGPWCRECNGFVDPTIVEYVPRAEAEVLREQYAALQRTWHKSIEALYLAVAERAQARDALLTIGERVMTFGGFQRTPRGEFWVSRDDVCRAVDEAVTLASPRTEAPESGA